MITEECGRRRKEDVEEVKKQPSERDCWAQQVSDY